VLAAHYTPKGRRKQFAFARIGELARVSPASTILFRETNTMPIGKLSSQAITQVGLVVRDIDTTSRAFADLFGVEVPAWHMTDTADTAHTRYRGQPTEARAKLAFFRLPGVTIELIEPVGGPSTWQEFLETRGEGVHHIAFQVPDMPAEVAMLEAKGLPAVQSGDYTGGCYTYIDGEAKLGIILELLARTG